MLWLALHKRLATMDREQKWGTIASTNCVLCDDQVEETFEHLFFDCTYSITIWLALVKWLGYHRQPGDWNCESSPTVTADQQQ